MQLFMVIRETDIDKAEYVVAKHAPEAIWKVSQIIEMDKIEMLDAGYQAIPIPSVTLDGYEIKPKKSKTLPPEKYSNQYDFLKIRHS